jgi:hypothetical protein
MARQPIRGREQKLRNEIAMVNSLERRTFQRLEFPIEVTAEIVPGGNMARKVPLAPVRSRNMSTTGICLEAKSLEVGGINLLMGPPHARENLLLMKMSLIPEEPPLQALGEVRWYDIVHDETPCIYLLGVEFVEIKDSGKAQLLRFLKSHKHTDGFLQSFL